MLPPAVVAVTVTVEVPSGVCCEPPPPHPAIPSNTIAGKTNRTQRALHNFFFRVKGIVKGTKANIANGVQNANPRKLEAAADPVVAIVNCNICAVSSPGNTTVAGLNAHVVNCGSPKHANVTCPVN